MKIGFLTACLAGMDLQELVPWAAAQGFEMLELAAWPEKSRKRDYQPRHINAARFTKDDAARVNDLFARHGMGISSLAFYENNLHPDIKKRRANHTHLRKVIDAAALLGVDLVGTFVGARAVSADLAMQEIGKIFRDLTAYAADRGVRLMIENCPMDNWVRFGLPGNFAYSPELWDALFNEVPADNFGLNIDPSHLYWLQIDYLKVIRDYAGRIFHAHAKDTEILDDGLYRYGILSQRVQANPWKSGWWRYRMPGKGGIDWKAFIDMLRESGYDFVLSIEHEDPEYEGSESKIKEGLRLGLDHLAPFCHAAEIETHS